MSPYFPWQTTSHGPEGLSTNFSGRDGELRPLQGDKADLSDTRFHRLQRECGEVAGMGGPYRASAFEVHPPPCKVEAQLFATRRRGARKPLAEEETPLASGTLWDSRGGDSTDATHEKPLFSASFELRQRPQWDRRGVKPLKMGVFTDPACLEGFKPTAKTAQNHWNVAKTHDYNIPSCP